jgi:uncharacterized protein (TIGR04222 family)
MDWLLNNPIADLSGPAFLLVYALLAAAIIVASRLQVRAGDASLAVPLPPVATDRDPSQVAYLRGGPNELLRFTIFDLIRLGFLRLCDAPPGGKAQKQQIVATGIPGSEQLTGFQREVVTFYATPHTTAELFKSNLGAAAILEGDTTYKPALEAEHFLSSPEVRSNATLVRLYGALVLTGFAAYRLFVAMMKGHNNVIFLTFMVIMALVALLLLTTVPRLSRRGREYLSRLATALQPSSAGPALAGAAVVPILVAAGGMAALAGTEYAQMNAMFPRRAANSSGGCSSSCSGGCGSSSSSSSSSCSSGSSCGGGSGCGG